LAAAVAARHSRVRFEVRTLVARLGRDEGGQDLVEYALLVAFFGITFLAVWTSVFNAVGARYGGTRAGMQGLWDPPDPGGSP
jgi:Flp pilus assembly pilin Flp